MEDNIIDTVDRSFDQSCTQGDLILLPGTGTPSGFHGSDRERRFFDSIPG